MPNSLKCKIKRLCHNGTITEREHDRILKALEQEPCEDAVSREAVHVLLHELEEALVYEKNYISRERDTTTIIEDILALPSVTPKQRTGHWITQWNVVHQTEYYYCSECREEFSYDGETGIKMNDYDFCPHCGAKMEGESE